ncbi:hypothetical protein V6N12_013762 [Hibiscus sabdariffa]|uniref:Uncharacterized protein n=1 Tax=Hibiscus sabdariffa TaxID=183260 RepID=A0ABR2CXR3_9ROSI
MPSVALLLSPHESLDIKEKQQSHTNFGLASSPSWTVCEGFKRLVLRAMIEHCTIFNKHACHAILVS